MKKWTILLICIALLFICASASAAVIASGDNAGVNVSWSLDDSGTLTISGTGYMLDNLSSTNLIKWKDYIPQIKNVVIEENITYIGDCTFGDHTALQTVTIKGNVTDIGKYAFDGCSNLTQINLPDSLQEIKKEAFSGCESLMSLTIPDGLKKTGNNVFQDCPVILTANIGTSGARALCTCDKSFRTPDGLFTLEYLSIKEYADLALLSVNQNLSAIELPAEITIIDEAAFANNSALSSLTISDTISSGAENAFAACTGLKEITLKVVSGKGFSVWSTMLPSALIKNINFSEATEIKKDAFRDCPGIRSITIPGNITSIGEYAFSGCTDLTTLTVSGSVSSIGKYAFSGCTGLKTLTLQAGVAEIGDRAFSGCSALDSLTIPDTVADIGGYAFSGCTGLTALVIPNSVTDMGQGIFSDCSGVKKVQFSSSMGSIPAVTFKNCTGLTELTVPGTIEALGGSAFEGCTGLTEVILSEGVTTLDGNCFLNCSNLTKATLPESLTTVSGNPFGLTGLTDVYYAGSFDQRFSKKFDDSWLNSATWHYGKTNAKKWNSLSWYVGDGDVLVISGQGGMSDVPIREWTTYTDRGTAIKNRGPEDTAWRVYKTALKKIRIEEGVTSIGKYAFESFDKLESVSLPSSLTRIGEEAFARCGSLYEINLPEGLTAIDTNAFSLCGSIWKITLPESLTSIGFGAFQQTGLRKITIPAGITSIEGATFWSCGSLESVELPESIISIGSDAFKSSAIRTISIPYGVTSIADDAFDNCGKLTSVEVPECNQYAIGYFKGKCPDLLHIGPHVKIVIDPAVEPTDEHPGLTEGSHCEACGAILVAQEEIDMLEHQWGKPEYTWSEDNSEVTATRVCEYNPSHTQTETVKTTYKVKKEATTQKTGSGVYTSKAFKNKAFAVQTKTVKIPKYPKTYQDKNCKYQISDKLIATVTGPAKATLKTIIIPDTITVNGKKMKVVGIKAKAFKNNKKARKVTIGKYVTDIGKQAFYGCVQLKTVSGMAGVTTIGDSAFEKCKVLLKLTIPAKVKKIGTKAFFNCPKLATITIQTAKLTEKNVGANAFNTKNKKTVYKVPAKKLKAYRKWMVKKGVPDTKQIQ